MNTTIKVLLIGVGVFFVLLVGFVIYAVFRPMYVKREIAKDVSITSEWIEFTPTSTMKIYRDFQAVTLVIDGVKTKGHGLFLEDGTQISPEIQIADVDGNWYELRGGSYTVSNYDIETDTHDATSASFSARDPKLPANTEFRTIRMRSDRPFCVRQGDMDKLQP